MRYSRRHFFYPFLLCLCVIFYVFFCLQWIAFSKRYCAKRLWKTFPSTIVLHLRIHTYTLTIIYTHMLANREKDMKRDRERESERNREPAFGTILECHSKTKQSHMETIKFLSMYAPCFQFSRNEHTATTHTRSISAFLECRQYFQCTLNAAWCGNRKLFIKF